MSYLLDTNTLSELRKRRPDPRVTSWFDTIPKAELYLSCLTVGEIRRGRGLFLQRFWEQSHSRSGLDVQRDFHGHEERISLPGGKNAKRHLGGKRRLDALTYPGQYD